MSILIPIRNRLFNRLPYSVLMEFSHNGINQGRSFGSLNGLTPVALCLIPRRRFGQGRKIQIFGHAQKRSRSTYPDAWPFIFFVPLFILVFTVVDYDLLKKKFGWSFPNFTQLIRSGGTKEDLRPLLEARRKPNSEAGVWTGVAENREEIHKCMQREAMKRYHQEVTVMASQDSELKALLDTEDINELERLEKITQDKELFNLKQLWVRDYKEAVRDSEKDGDFTVVEPSLEEKLDFSGKWNMLKSKLFAESPGDFDSIESDNDSEPEESQNMGFRSRKIAEYEDRLRQYSTPDKIFSETD